MYLRLLLTWSCVVAMGYAQISQQLDMFGLINILYWKADANRDGTISFPEFQDIWDGFDQNGDKVVTSGEFIPSWGALTTMSQELSTAYFYLADIDDNGNITTSDLNLVYQRFDINGDGTVTAEEFNLKWQQLYREAPFAVLYLRTDTNKDDDLQSDEFSHLFSSLGSNADGSVAKAEFQQNWVKFGFGSGPDAGVIFSRLDKDGDGVLTTAEVAQLFSQYDVSKNGDVELLELVEIAKLVPTPAPN